MPMLAGTALQTAYSIINAIWVGNGLGTEAVAALAVSFPVFFILMAVAGGLTLASTILISQAYGAKDWTRISRVIQNSTVLTLAISTICATLGFVFSRELLQLMQTPADVLPVAVDYLRWFVWTTPFMFLMFLIAAVLRGVGDSRTPLYFQAASVLLTAALDPVFMFGWLGAPRLGLNGTALATIISQALSVVAVSVYLRAKDHIASPRWSKLRADWATSWLTLRIGIPSMIQQALVSLGMLVIMSLVNKFGKDAAAAYGVAMRIDQLAFMPAMTIGMAVSGLAGQNLGARQFGRVHRIFLWGLLFGGGLTLLPTVLALTIPTQLMGIFIKDPEVITLGAGYLHILGLAYMLFASMFVTNGVINGAGDTKATTAFTLIGLWIVRVPLAMLLAGPLGLQGIWIAVAIGFGAGMLSSLAYYLSGYWKRLFERVQPQLPTSPASAQPEVV